MRPFFHHRQISDCFRTGATGRRRPFVRAGRDGPSISSIVIVSALPCLRGFRVVAAEVGLDAPVPLSTLPSLERGGVNEAARETDLDFGLSSSGVCSRACARGSF